MVVVSVVKLSQVEGAWRLDADHYQPEYIEAKNRLSVIKTVVRLKDIASITTGPAYSSKEMGENFDIPMARIGDVTNKTDVEDWIKLSKEEFEKFDCKKIGNLDILMTMTGDPPDVGKCNLIKISNDKTLAFNQRVAKVSAKISPYYLFAYLSTEIARMQSERSALGIRQRNVGINDLKNIRVVLPSSNTLRLTIDNLVSQYLAELENSKSLYSQAENLLLEGLGLKDFKLKYELFYTASLSKAFGAHRVDAEHFQPAYEQLIKYISGRGAYTIRQIQTFNARGVQPLYVEDGDIKVVTSKNLGRDSINYWGLYHTTRREWEKNKDARIRKFDILIYTTGAYVGRTNCYLQDNQALASNHVNILRVTGINPLFVGVCLNSVLGQVQVNRSVSGSAQAELYPSDISKFVVWNAPEQTQQKIASLVQEFHEARKKARELLEQAKSTVEQMIETASTGND